MATEHPRGAAPGPSRLSRALLGLLLVLALASPQHYRPDIHPANEATRIYAAQAIVELGTVQLDGLFDRYFPGWRRSGHPPNLDVAKKDGHYLLDKAPGLTLLAVPVVAILNLLGLHPGFDGLAWLLVLLLTALPTAAFAHLFVGRVAPALRRPGIAWLVGLALVLATPWLAYAGMLFGHALAASLVGAGLLLALGPLRPTDPGTSPRPRLQTLGEPFAGGLLLGAGVLTEYPSALYAVIACAALLADRSRRRRLLPLVLGGLGPAAVLLAWNAVSFGGPLQFSYGFKADPSQVAIHATGAYGITWPSPERLLQLLAGPQRGLLFLSPWLLAGFAGAVVAVRSPRLPLAWRLTLGAGPLLAPLVIAGFVDWQAGMSMGPRHLLPLLPLLGVAAALALDRAAESRRGKMLLVATGGLMVSSLLLCGVGAYVFPYFPTGAPNPLFEVVVPVLLDGGPGATLWDSVFTPPVGALLGAGAAITVLGWGLRRALRGAVGLPAAAAAVGLAVILHVGLATLPAAETPREQRRVLLEQAFVQDMLGRGARAEEIRRALRRVGRPALRPPPAPRPASDQRQ